MINSESLRGTVIEPEYTWVGDAFQKGVQIAIGLSGLIEDAGHLNRPDARPLPGIALVPGFVNAHSHAFQRGLRGRGESFPAGAGSFWSWREAMYSLAQDLNAEQLHAITLQSYKEMLASGITSVGEFHYLHHAGPDRDYTLDDAIIAAASDAGIRLVLLNAYYRTGAIGRGLEDAQRRFETASPTEYWQQFDRLSARLRSDQTLGAVAHSIRAVPIDDLIALHREATFRDLVFHMHVEEQQKEIDDCRAAYGSSPLEILCDRLTLSPRFTAVHCTHSSPAPMDRFLATGANVCITPTTEANLGDGIPDVTAMLARQSTPCLGSDSNARISMLEEMRWLEYGQRLRGQTRGVFANKDGEVAPVLIEAATLSGATSLGIRGGRIAPGMVADLVALDLDTPSIAGCDANTLAAALTFGASEEVVAATAVSGVWRFVRRSS